MWRDDSIDFKTVLNVLIALYFFTSSESDIV